MKRAVWFFLSASAIAAGVVAHEGHDHNMLGTVERARPCHFVMKTQKGETKTIFITAKTSLERAGKSIALSDITTGMRVSVTVENDGETAVSVKAGGMQ